MRIQELKALEEILEAIARRGFDCASLEATLAPEPLDRWTSRDGGSPGPESLEAFLAQERRYDPDLNDGVRVNIAPLQRPDGDVLWTHRRAVVGHGLKHPAALRLSVTASGLECWMPRGVSAFRTYGSLGFFHGGATLQELVVPVVIARWPKKARKVAVVLSPITEITSLAPRVEVKPESVQMTIDAGVEASLLARQVTVTVADLARGTKLFGAPAPFTIEPGGGPLIVELHRVPGTAAPRNARLQVLDADDEEILDRQEVLLRVDLEEWD